MSESNPIIRNVSVIEDSTVVADASATQALQNSPSMIPDDDAVVDADKDDDESDYSYAYDDEEEGHYSGFLIPTEPVVAVMVEEDAPVGNAAAVTTTATEDRKQKWVEPTPAAVTMSLRAERETTGGRRRLASDLYKIMSSSTVEAGFTLEPAFEDSMDKWTIKLFGFDEDSNLAKDLVVCNLECVELEMSFPEQYPFEPPFVRVVSPRFQRQTGFVMNGALCMELLTKDGWNPINDIESVIVSIRSLMVVGDGRVKAAVEMAESQYEEALRLGLARMKAGDECDDEETSQDSTKRKRSSSESKEDLKKEPTATGKKTHVGSYTAAEASSAYDHLSKFHQEKGWDKSGWWAKRG